VQPVVLKIKFDDFGGIVAFFSNNADKITSFLFIKFSMKSKTGQGLPCFIRRCPVAQQFMGKRNEAAKATPIGQHLKLATF